MVAAALMLLASPQHLRQRIALQDTSAAAGIRFILRDAATPEHHQIEPMVGGVAIFDYNNDDKPDVYFVNGAQQPQFDKSDPAFFNRLYRNDGNGRFTDVTENAGVRGAGFTTGVAATDYDNDGFTDLFLAGVDRNTMYRNLGNGSFEDVTKSAGLANKLGSKKPWSIAAGWFDYDRDGLLDLFVVNYCAWNPEKEQRCTVGKSHTYCHPKYYEGLPNQLYHNNGDGTFTDVSAAAGIAQHIGKGMAVAFLDFDQDGRLDAYVTNDTIPNFLFRNEGNGRFREVALEAGAAFIDDARAVSSMGIDARDIDNDGREDLFLTANHNETFPFFRNIGKGLFADATYPSGIGKSSMSVAGWSNGIYDLDNDGHKDLFAACGAIDSNVEEYSSRKSKQSSLLLSNVGNRRFADATAGPEILPIGRHRGAAFGDLDGDGKVDIVVTRIGEPAELLRNVSDTGNHWLAVRLRGRKSNRQGLGAMVHIVGASGAEQWNRVTTATGYASSSQPVAFFGLGKDTVVRKLEVQWPGGMLQAMESVAGDRYLTVEEP
jgi:enediyne biosynthesis protein E4